MSWAPWGGGGGGSHPGPPPVGAWGADAVPLCHGGSVWVSASHLLLCRLFLFPHLGCVL